jgi:hypothetical protein
MNRWTSLAVAVGILLGLVASLELEAKASRNSSGTYSLPAGNPVVTGTTITSTWANNTNSDIATEITNSLDRSGRGCMTGQMQSASGTVSAPGVTFCSDTASGLYRNGSHDLRFAVNGVDSEIWRVDHIDTVSSLYADAGIVATSGIASQYGVYSTGGVDGGGIYGKGSAVNGAGVTGQGTGTGAGVYGVSSTTAGSVGGKFANATASGAGTPQVAADLSNGTLTLSMTAPNPDAGFTNTLAPTNLVKAWAKVAANNGTPQIQSGFNVTTSTCAGGIITVNLSAAMTSTATMAVLVTTDGTTQIMKATAASTTSVQIAARDTAGSAIDLCGLTSNYSVMVLGPQ